MCKDDWNHLSCYDCLLQYTVTLLFEQVSVTLSFSLRVNKDEVFKVLRNRIPFTIKTLYSHLVCLGCRHKTISNVIYHVKNIYRSSLFLNEIFLNLQFCTHSSKFRLTQINLCLLSATGCANYQIRRLVLMGGQPWGWTGLNWGLKRLKRLTEAHWGLNRLEKA